LEREKTVFVGKKTTADERWKCDVAAINACKCPIRKRELLLKERQVLYLGRHQERLETQLPILA